MPNFTKKAIENSFLKLLNSKPLNKVTVKDIVEDCGINRNSFYYHFEDIPALMRCIMNEAFDNLISGYPAIHTFKDCIKSTIEFTLQNKKAVLNIYNSTSRDIFEKYLWESCEYCVSLYLKTFFGDYDVGEEDKKIISDFYVCLVYGQTSRWLAEGLKEDIVGQYDKIFELSNGMITGMFRFSENKKDN